jgi:hypothetical protein
MQRPKPRDRAQLCLVHPPMLYGKNPSASSCRDIVIEHEAARGGI